ncbi:glucans biosynthesis protein [Klebsiella pneumoniae]|nr:glucans biosynthesis protein [Klebsiella pneumoniae]
MQVFFVISGYFSYMLFLRYPLKKVVEKCASNGSVFPMLTAIPLLTLPQFIMLQYVNGKAENWHTLSGYDKFNTLAWELISHLWFLLVLVVLTSLGVVLFKWLTRRPAGGASAFGDTVTMGQLTMIFLALGVLYALIPPIAVPDLPAAA